MSLKEDTDHADASRSSQTAEKSYLEKLLSPLVQEKLNDAEYKEFVGFMKALKSKDMKIGQVLQSIVALFSSPDRLPLRQRFKDYIPAKYLPLYEEYLARYSDAVLQ